MARAKWPFGPQHPHAQPDSLKPVKAPALASADAKKFGLENYCNNCYVNSVVQALYFCTPFRDLMLQSSDSSVPQLSSPSHPSSPVALAPVRRKPERKGSISIVDTAAVHGAVPIPISPPSLFSALRSLFAYISTHPAERGTVSPRVFIDKLKAVNQVFNTTTHQDAHEFLNYLLNRIVEEMEEDRKNEPQPRTEELLSSLATLVSNSTKSQKDSTLVHRLFEGVLTSETRCLTCETVSSRDESFLDLSIDIEQNSSVTACLRQFSASEMLCQRNKFFCDACCDLQEAEKRMKIKRLPNVLALHLKRFKYQEDVQKYIKLAYRVAFPFELRLFNTVDEMADADRLYNLFGIVVHIGNGPHHGHYVSIIKTLGTWLLFDDENVTPVSEADIPKYFGDSSAGCAYVLYYQAADIDMDKIGLKPSPSTTNTTSTPVSNGGPVTNPLPAHPPGLVLQGNAPSIMTSTSNTPSISISIPASAPLISPISTSSGQQSSRYSTDLEHTSPSSSYTYPTNGRTLSPIPSPSPSSPKVSMSGLFGAIRKSPSTSIKIGQGNNTIANEITPASTHTAPARPKIVPLRSSPSAVSVAKATSTTAGAPIQRRSTTTAPSPPSEPGSPMNMRRSTSQHFSASSEYPASPTMGVGGRPTASERSLLSTSPPISVPTVAQGPTASNGFGKEGEDKGYVSWPREEKLKRNVTVTRDVVKDTGREEREKEKEKELRQNWFGRRRSFLLGGGEKTRPQLTDAEAPVRVDKDVLNVASSSSLSPSLMRTPSRRSRPADVGSSSSSVPRTSASRHPHQHSASSADSLLGQNPTRRTTLMQARRFLTSASNSRIPPPEQFKLVNGNSRQDIRSSSSSSSSFDSESLPHGNSAITPTQYSQYQNIPHPHHNGPDPNHQGHPAPKILSSLFPTFLPPPKTPPLAFPSADDSDNTPVHIHSPLSLTRAATFSASSPPKGYMMRSPVRKRSLVPPLGSESRSSSGAIPASGPSNRKMNSLNRSGSQSGGRDKKGGDVVPPGMGFATIRDGPSQATTRTESPTKSERPNTAPALGGKGTRAGTRDLPPMPVMPVSFDFEHERYSRAGNGSAVVFMEDRGGYSHSGGPGPVSDHVAVRLTTQVQAPAVKGNAHPTSSSSGVLNLKNATRKLGLAGPMFGMGRREKEEKKEKEKKVMSSAFTRL